MATQTHLPTDAPPPMEGNWELVKDFMQLPHPKPVVRIQDLPREQILAALPALPWHERDLIERVYFKGQSLSQVARDVKTPTLSVWRVHLQASIHLRAELAKQPADV